MAQFNPKQSDLEIIDPNWKSLCKIGRVAALIFLVYSLVTMILLMTIGGQPTTAEEGFKMLHDNRVVKLLRLDALTILVMPLYYLLFLGLYTALKKTDGAYAILATTLAFAGVTLFLATPSAFSWLALSDKFAAATTDAHRDQFLAASEAILASDMWHGSGAIMGGILLQTGTLLISVVMLRGKTFGKLIAYVGTVTHGIDLAHLLVGLFFPTGGVILMAIAGPLYWCGSLCWPEIFSGWRRAVQKIRRAMGPAHFAIGLAAKPVAPKAPLWVLLVASQALDLLCFGFMAIGMENSGVNSMSLDQGLKVLALASIPWSHGLFMSVVWSVVAVAIAHLIYRDRRTSSIIGLVVFSHWVLDFIVHPGERYDILHGSLWVPGALLPSDG